MENTGLKGLLVTLYQRVIKSYKTTLIGMAVVAGGVIVENMIHSPNKTITIIGGIIGAVLALIKEPPKAAPASAAEE